MDSKYITLSWHKHVKMFRVGRLYMEIWRHPNYWYCAKTDNFYSVHIGHFSLAWARFEVT